MADVQGVEIVVSGTKTGVQVSDAAGRIGVISAVNAMGTAAMSGRSVDGEMMTAEGWRGAQMRMTLPDQGTSRIENDRLDVLRTMSDLTNETGWLLGPAVVTIRTSSGRHTVRIRAVLMTAVAEAVWRTVMNSKSTPSYSLSCRNPVDMRRTKFSD
mmetsp:Transcript_4749/g.10121  ORF Transcript_4749/g.10121 Transcript_4749/m.10121 type:complete len:156 (-) Transcript_4749:904-1371(-)